MPLPELDQTKLTAYALGELDDAERAAVDANLRESEYARKLLRQVQGLAGLISNELESEAVEPFTLLQRAEIAGRIEELSRQRRERPRRREARWNRAVLGFSMAAAVLIVGSALALMAPLLYRQFQTPREAQAYAPSTPYLVHEQSPRIQTLPSGDDAMMPPHRTKDLSVDVPDQERDWPTGGAPATTPRDEPIRPLGGHPLLGATHDPDHGETPVAAVRLIHEGSNAWKGGDFSQAHPVGSSAAPSANPNANWFSAYVARPGGAAGAPRVNAAGPAVDTESYDHFDDNPFVITTDHPLSRFAADCGNASYVNLRRSLNQNRLPAPDAVRVEEVLNSFPWRCPPPEGDEKFTGLVEVGICPWNVDHRLARVVVGARDTAPEARPPVNLVFLIDLSRSMGNADRLGMVRKALKLLLGQLGRRDRLCIVATPQPEGFLLPPTSGDNHLPILDAIERLRAGDTFAAGSGVETAYYAAASSFIHGGINRVVLITDGNWLAGAADPAALSKLVEDRAAADISLGVLAVSPRRLDDPALRHLAVAGHGTLSLVDSAADAQRVLFDQANGALIEAAHDVRIAVKINPAVAQSYRLLGYERRLLNTGSEDDGYGGEIGAGHAVTALYELAPLKAAATEPPLAVTVRYKNPGEEDERSFVLDSPFILTPLSKVSNDYKFAAAIAEFAMAARHSDLRGTATFSSALDLAAQGRGPDELGMRQEFIDLLRKAKTISPRG